MDDAKALGIENLLAAVRREPGGMRAATEPGMSILQAVVDAAVTLFEAEAASIALFEIDPERLEFVVAAGAQGQGVVGLSVAPTRGIAGYVFSTGEAMALSDVTADPRFDRVTAERTGYVPRSIAAVPLISAGDTLGVLQVLDKQASPTFTLPDMDRLGVFAGQAATAIEASMVGRDATRLLRRVLTETGDPLPDPAQVVAAAATHLDRPDEAPFWRLVARLSALRDLSDAELELMVDILAVVASRPVSSGTYRRRGR